MVKLWCILRCSSRHIYWKPDVVVMALPLSWNQMWTEEETKSNKTKQKSSPPSLFRPPIEELYFVSQIQMDIKYIVLKSSLNSCESKCKFKSWRVSLMLDSSPHLLHRFSRWSRRSTAARRGRPLWHGKFPSHRQRCAQLPGGLQPGNNTFIKNIVFPMIEEISVMCCTFTHTTETDLSVFCVGTSCCIVFDLQLNFVWSFLNFVAVSVHSFQGGFFVWHAHN